MQRKTNKIPLHIFLNSPTWIPLLAIVFFYFFVRVLTLSQQPMFIDEAIYMRWSQLVLSGRDNWFISLTDGKQPLFIWFSAIALFFVKDPLLAGRLVSVISGLFTLLGLFFLTRELFKNNIAAYYSALLYALFPMALVYDRMALYDSLVGTLGVYSLLFLVYMIRRRSYLWSVALGITWGMAILNKSSGFLLIGLSPLVIVALTGGKIFRREVVFSLFLRFVLSCSLALGLYGLLIVSPLFYMIYEKNSLFVYHLAELIPYNAFMAWPGNVLSMIQWLVTYSTLTSLVALFYAFYCHRMYMREKIVLLCLFIIPLLLLGLFGRVIHPRFIFFISLFLFPLIGLGVEKVFSLMRSGKKFGMIMFSLFFLPVIYSVALILSNFSHAPIPKEDLVQYSNDWPSGAGMAEIMGFINGQRHEKGAVAVYTEGVYGGLPTTVSQIYFASDNAVTLVAFDTIDADLRLALLQSAEQKPTYIIFNKLQKIPKTLPFILKAQYRNGAGTTYSRLFEVTKRKG